MNNFKAIVFLALSVCFTFKTYSQGSASIHLGPSFPISYFASDPDFASSLGGETVGGAAVGFNVGLQYIYPLTENGLGIFGGIDFNYNKLKREVKDDLEELFESPDINVDIKGQTYINVPITFGLNYTYLGDDIIGVFVNAGLALNFFKITDLTVKLDGQAVTGQTLTFETDVANSIGLKIGGGVLIKKKTSISINYLGLGKHNLDIEAKSTIGGSLDEYDAEQTVDLLTLTVGIRF